MTQKHGDMETSPEVNVAIDWLIRLTAPPFLDWTTNEKANYLWTNVVEKDDAIAMEFIQKMSVLWETERIRRLTQFREQDRVAQMRQVMRDFARLVDAEREKLAADTGGTGGSLHLSFS